MCVWGCQFLTVKLTRVRKMNADTTKKFQLFKFFILKGKLVSFLYGICSNYSSKKERSEQLSSLAHKEARVKKTVCQGQYMHSSAGADRSIDTHTHHGKTCVQYSGPSLDRLARVKTVYQGKDMITSARAARHDVSCADPR